MFSSESSIKNNVFYSYHARLFRSILYIFSFFRHKVLIDKFICFRFTILVYKDKNSELIKCKRQYIIFVILLKQSEEKMNKRK